MGQDLLLIGSVPYDTAAEVMRNFGGPLGKYLPAVPDGEIGERRWWVQRLSYQVFNGHPELVTLRRPAPEKGVERLLPRDRSEFWQFQVKDGTAAVRFGDPGWRLGFARDAINSYFVFQTLRDQGIIPAGVRFQVSLPLVNSVVRPVTFPHAGDLDRVKPGYEAALAAEIAKIVDKIPAADLALQWDLAQEVIDLYGGDPALPREGALERNVAQIRTLSRVVPQDVALGIHLCFGTYGGWPRFAPDTLGTAVDYANACVAAAGRRIDWLHIPAIDTAEDSFYAPLAKLDPRGARVYLGLIHNMATFKERLAVARKYLPEFGLGAYCGLGRNAPETLPQTLADHLAAVKIAGKD
jgi:hypothetical protein